MLSNLERLSGLIRSEALRSKTRLPSPSSSVSASTTAYRGDRTSVDRSATFSRPSAAAGAPGAARWLPDEEQKLRRLVEAERAANGGNYIRGSFWAAAAEALATKRTETAVKQHWQVMNGAPRPSKKARTDEPPPPEEADDQLLDPFGLRAGLAALFSWAPSFS